MEEKKKNKPRGKSVALKYTDEELIEWISKFERRCDMRTERSSMYMLCLRRNLQQYFPPKRTCKNTIAGLPKPPKEKGKRGRPFGTGKKDGVVKPAKEPKTPKKSPEPEVNDLWSDTQKTDRTAPSRMFKATKLTGTGNIICGRCLEEKEPYSGSKSICKACYMRCYSLKAMGKDTNKWNVRDPFTNIVIRHQEKVFEIGIKTDEATELYLRTVGYSFLFKEEYDR